MIFRNIKIGIVLFYGFIVYANPILKLPKDLSNHADLISKYFAQKIDIDQLKDIDLNIEFVKKIIPNYEDYICKIHKDDNDKIKGISLIKEVNETNAVSIGISKFDSIEDIRKNGLGKHIRNMMLGDSSMSLMSSNSAIKYIILSTTSNNIGSLYNYGNRTKKFFRENLFIVIYSIYQNNLSEELFQLAKKIDHKICELNGIPYDPNFPEKEDNDSEEDKEVKRKIADGTYTKIEDLPKPQSQSDNVKNNVKNRVKDPQEEKTVTKIDSPISPKIENSKSKIFIIFGILFTVVFGGFAICKTRKKKNKIKNNETNN